MKKYIYWIPVIIWMTIIFLFSSRQRVTVSEVELVNFLFFKTLHVIEYAILYILLFRAEKYSGTPVTTTYRMAFFLTVLYAATDELHQTFVPTRDGRVRDVIIDAIGGAISWISIRHIQHILPKKLNNWVAKWQII